MDKKIILIILSIVIVSSVITVDAYTPIGKYITISLNPPETDQLGGVYSTICDGGEYVSGLYSNGTWICSALP